MRLIDADALKAVFEEKSSEAVCGVELCKAIIRRIEEAPTVDITSIRHREWILLSEKIPEMDERVVVTTHGFDYHIWDCMSNRGDNYFWEDEEGLYHNKYEVVSWLPLPEVML